jgi:hypothetical protein
MARSSAAALLGLPRARAAATFAVIDRAAAAAFRERSPSVPGAEDRADLSLPLPADSQGAAV